VRFRKEILKRLFGSVLPWYTVALLGCATEQTSDQVQLKYQVADAEQAVVERFKAEQRRCWQRGGHMVLIMSGGGKIDRGTMESAYCEIGSGALGK
jgi:hypothetical protein